jgi:hypothetical protein
MATFLNCMNSGLQSALITVFEFASLRAVFEALTQNALARAGRRWSWAEKLKMGPVTSERVFVALAVATVGILSVLNNSTANQKLLDASYQAISTTIVLMVLLRIGIFSSAIMFFTNLLVLRMPLTFDSNASYAGGSWVTIAGIFALAVWGFWEARKQSPIPYL